MKRIETNGYSLEVGNLTDSSFESILSETYKESKKIIMVDEHTREDCLGYLLSNFESLSEAEVIVIPAGEDSKDLEIATNVWEALTEYGVTRYDLIINLGGGVITDLGGFIAACYKRGCAFINIPTSLLAMIDASIGGKTAVNLGIYKNQVGVFKNPVALYIDPVFLETLPEEEWMSGFGEMLKHGLIADATLYKDVCEQLEDIDGLTDELLIRSIEVKKEVVEKDPFEIGDRKILNFGHTVGHVFEGHFMYSQPITHGHAVAIGMLVETYLSTKITGFPIENYSEMEQMILLHYPMPKLSNEDIQSMIELLDNDKKNKSGKIMCCLLIEVGKCTYDNPIKPEQFLEALLHFKNKQVNLN